MGDPLLTIVEFLVSIGIPTREEPVPSDSFLPGLCIKDGGLLYERFSLQWPGDLLHEAGHVATTPAALRPILNDTLDSSLSIPHMGEAESIAWSYAAIIHLGLDPSILFHLGGYGGNSSGLHKTFSLGVYPGASGLSLAGMTLLGNEARLAGQPAYPNMLRWLRV